MAIVTIGDVGGRNLHVSSAEGILYCDCSPWRPGMQYTPCAHVFAAMKNRLDAEAPLGTRVVVPIYEEPVDGVHLTLWVTTKHAERRGSMTPFYFEGVRVGWLDEGEGRQAVRWVLLEYLRSKYHEAPPCSDSKHANYLLSQKERRKLDLDSKQKTVIAGIASVLTTGTCWRCVNAGSDDLVPDI